jgi:hypothetical protein
MSPSISTNSLNSPSGPSPSPSIPPNSSTPFRTWSVVHAARVAAAAAAAASASGGSAPLELEGGSMGSFPSHPYRRPLFIPKFDEDFPLRKTGELRIEKIVNYHNKQIELELINTNSPRISLLRQSLHCLHPHVRAFFLNQDKPAGSGFLQTHMDMISRR